VRPRSRTEFWSAELSENVLRDHRQTIEIEKLGWKVVRLWEHEVFADLANGVSQIEVALGYENHNPCSNWRVIKASPLEGDMEERDLVDLRDLSVQRTVIQKRSTKKW